MAYDHDFIESLEDIRNMIEWAYVHHQDSVGGGWKLHFFEFSVEIFKVNELELSVFADTYRADFELLKSCDNEQPCLFSFDCRIVCVDSVCEYLLLRWNQALFEQIM